MSIYTENIKTSSVLYLKNMDSEAKSWIKPKSGENFKLISITVAPMGGYSQSYISPYTSDFLLIDGSTQYSPKLEICDDPLVEIEDIVVHDKSLNERYVFDNFGEIYVGQNIYRTLNKHDYSGSKE